MGILLKSVVALALTGTFISCGSLGPLATVGDDQIVVDDATGNEISLPDSLDQTSYANEAVDSGIAIQTTLKDGQLLEPTPLRHPNATVYFTPEAYASFRAGKSIFINVGSTDDPQGRALMVPGSLWWPSAGLVSSATMDSNTLGQKLLEELNAATGSDTTIQLIFYCDRPGCWSPYNVALRLANTPYKNVVWYRGGTSAWHEAKLPLEIAPAPDWE